MSEPSIADRLTTINTELSGILTNSNTQLENKGQSTVQNLSGIPTAIAGIETGKLTNTEYNEANQDLDSILNGTDTPGVVILKSNEAVIELDSAGMSGRSGIVAYIRKISNLDLSNYISLINLFYGSSRLEEIEITAFPSTVMSYEGMFKSCESLVSVPNLTGAKVLSYTQAFRDCSNLENVPILDVSNGNVFILNGTFGNCSKLSNESLNNIMKMCIDATSKVTVQSFRTLKQVGLSQTQATTCQSLSNYNDFINAGWTTGY